MSRERFIVVLAPAAGWGAPPLVRLRKLLKAALRSHGLRCIRVAVEEPDGPDLASTFAGAAPGNESLPPPLAVVAEESRRPPAASQLLPRREAV